MKINIKISSDEVGVLFVERVGWCGSGPLASTATSDRSPERGRGEQIQAQKSNGSQG